MGGAMYQTFKWVAAPMFSEYERLYHWRKGWAYTPTQETRWKEPPRMALWDYTPGRNVILCGRKRFKWWTIHHAATEGWSRWVTS